VQAYLSPAWFKADRGWLGPVRLRRRAGALGLCQPPNILALCELRTSQCRMAHGIGLWCNATRPHWTRSGSGPSALPRAPRTSPAGVVNAGPSDFLFTAAADYLLLRIATRHNVGTSAVNGPSFSTLFEGARRASLTRGDGGFTTNPRVGGLIGASNTLYWSTGGRRHGRHLSPTHYYEQHPRPTSLRCCARRNHCTHQLLQLGTIGRD
jgi:hypothetical protein